MLIYTQFSYCSLPNQVKLKYNRALNTLELFLIAAYNLTHNSSSTINPVVKIALLLPYRSLSHVIYYTVLCMCMYSNSKPEIHQSRTLFDTQNPKWDAKFEFEVYDDNMVCI